MSKILAIDDREDNLISIGGLLEAYRPDYEVLTAQSGAAGIKLARAEKPDVILLDIKMPEMDGYEVCRRLKEEEGLKHIPIIFLTAVKTSSEDRIRGLELGGDAYLFKPVDSGELLAQLKVALRLKKAEYELRLEKESLAEKVSERTKDLEQFKFISNNSNDMHFMVSSTGQILYVNKSACKTFGYSLNQFLNLSILDIDKLHDESAFRTMIGKVLKGAINSIESVAIRKDQTTFPCEISLTRYNYNKSDFILAVLKDISKRKQAEEALQESEAFTRAVMDNLPIGVAVNSVDPTVEFSYMNDNFPKFYRTTREALAEPDSFWNSVYEDQTFRAEIKKRVLDDCATDDPNRMHWEDVPITRKGKATTYVNARNTPIPDKQLMISTVSDITDRKRAEEEREEALQDARNANKVKDLFLANMSHEIRTPLNSILGFTEVIEGRIKDQIDDKLREYFQIIHSGGKRLTKTVHEVLDISQIEAGVMPNNPQSIRLATSVKWIYKEFEPVAAAKNLEFNYENKIKDGNIIADEPSLVKAVSNLVENAIKYTKEGQINLRLNRKNGKYVLSISDTGIGMSPDYLSHLYEAFSQESTGYSRKYQGLGLGLAITKRCLEINDITIAVESEQGVGTTFSLTFTPADTARKLDEPEIKPEPVDLKVEKTVSKEKPVILLVEDDINNRKTLEIILKNKYETPGAVSVEDAKFQLRQYAVDLIILDLSLEGDEDGLDLVAYMKAKKVLKDIPVIAVTAHAFETDRDNVMKVGINDYMSKPIDIKQLLGMIDRYI